MNVIQKILISACLLGEKVRYDGGDCKQDISLLTQWTDEGRIVSICPEIAGGLAVPRSPAEIMDSKVITKAGWDITEEFNRGAELALAICKQHKIKFALLKAKSPSCGNMQIYDGTFSKTLINGQGITAALLQLNDIQVFNETEVYKLAEIIGTAASVEVKK